MRVEKSFCRLCLGMCGLDVTIGDDGRVASVRGDHDNPASQGYACIKGLEVPTALYGDKRIMRPRKRVGDSYVEIPLEQALDEIAAKMQMILDEDGPQSLAFFRGTGTFGSNVAIFSWPNLAECVGGQKFSTMTIDQSAKWVVQDRLGTWPAGKHPFMGSEVFLLAGTNPLVSVYCWDMPVQNPMKKLKEARANGLKLIVIDPRKTEMAEFADIHLQLYPGEDAAVAAGLIHVILANGWEDKEFCEAHVHGLEQLRREVAPFTPEVVAERAGIDADDLVAAARLFAHESKRGTVGTGTGVDMAPFPNLAEQLYETIGVICGRFVREGEPLPNPGVLIARQPPHAEPVGPARNFEKMPRSRVRGAVRLMGESATPTLAEEILTPGKGRVRGLLISGANPASAIPDSRKVVEAFRALDLLVVVEPFETETVKLADYVIPPKILFEHADLTFGLEANSMQFPYSQYTAALVDPPEGSELADEGYVAWSLAKRLGKTLTYFGTDLDMETPPSDDYLLSLLAANANVPFERIKQEAVGGRIFDDIPEVLVLPPSGNGGKFEVMPDDLAAEIRAFAAASPVSRTVGEGNEYPLRMISRRIREVSNTSCRDFPTARKRAAYNPLCAHPADLARLGLSDGDACWVSSDNGQIPAIVREDETLKPGCVSMTHGYGWLVGEDFDYEERGSSISLLVSLDRDCEPLQAMPRMSGVPVRVEAR
ncbi:MAG: molybdopterin-dependent oxidoreductase [Novosphingobium sp.]|nr:molybdopterin-dependent oxidoreductase [Novosphingobium sp.]MCP5403338.1 molybdopterin-dependent oxidoreductase [Novosphingobium sp.]